MRSSNFWAKKQPLFGFVYVWAVKITETEEHNIYNWNISYVKSSELKYIYSE